MSRQPLKPSIVLDWFTVTYRTAFLAGLVAVVVAGLVVGWLWFSGAGPRRDAQEAIDRAHEKITEAAPYPGTAALDDVRRNARVAFDEAGGSFADGRYEEARVSAIRAENLAQKALDIARGEGTADREVRVYKLEGDVRVKRAGGFSWDAADRKMTLREGDQIKTAANARAQIIYFDGTITTVEAGSLLEIRRVYEDPATRVRHVREKLSWGEILASTQKHAVRGSYHEVQTDAVTARTEEAATFRVAVDKETHNAAFDALTGTVQLSAPDRRETLAEGERIKASSKGSLSAKESLPGAPRLIAPSDQRVFVYDEPATTQTSLAWEAVPGAAAYRLVISNRPLFTSPLFDANRTQTTVAIDGVAPGEYYWRVAAVSPKGVPGPFSEDRRFRVSAHRIRDRGDTTPPRLEVTEKVQTGAMLILNGRTEPGAVLWVNDEKVDVSGDGSFYTVVRLRREGVNDIAISAQDAAGNVQKLVQRAYVDPL